MSIYLKIDESLYRDLGIAFNIGSSFGSNPNKTLIASLENMVSKAVFWQFE